MSKILIFAVVEMQSNSSLNNMSLKNKLIELKVQFKIYTN